MARPRHAPEDDAMATVLEAIAHRGPGGAAACAAASSTHRVALGYRRLGAEVQPQPLCDEPAGLALVVDGAAPDALADAYRRWDSEAVQHLHGPFAFALWDARKERLMLARDRFGEKPLYYCEASGSVFFASEAKALLAIPGIRAEVDLHSVRHLLACGYVPGPRTLFSGIRKLAPGSYALWQHGRRREARYWTPPDREAPGSRPAAGADAVAGFLAELDGSVKERLRGADAGVFLSGGLDSAALLALASRHQPRLRTYSVALEERPAGELARAAEVARHFGADHHELKVSRQALVDALPRLVACRDAPVSAPRDVALYLLAREAARASAIVLTGEGGDALLGGGRRHLAEHFGWPLARGDWRSRCLRAAGGLERAACDRLAGPLLNGAPVMQTRAPFDSAPGNSRLRRALYFEQASVLPDEVLERAERTAIAASVEARMPYVDERLAAFVSALPDTLRVRRLTTKWILRQAARPLVPRRLRRRASAAPAPLGGWLRGELRAMLLDHLHSRASLTRAYFNAPALDRMLEEHIKGRQDHQKLLWTLLNLEIWQRTYRPG